MEWLIYNNSDDLTQIFVGILLILAMTFVIGLNIYYFIKELKIFCKHKNKTETFRCYQDRYVREVCDNCGKVICSDL
jgi:hypothetical protein